MSKHKSLPEIVFKCDQCGKQQEPRPHKPVVWTKPLVWDEGYSEGPGIARLTVSGEDGETFFVVPQPKGISIY